MANLANVSTLTTDFNKPPYYDDFDPSDNYHRILFKPGYAVQSRELTQIQSILQNQIGKFGQHVFKEGSAVLGGKFYINTNVPFVKIKDTDVANNDVTLDNFLNQVMVGETSGVQAYVNIAEEGTETDANTKTLYVTYKSSGPTGNSVFGTSETLTCNIGNLRTLSSNTTGYGSIFTINEGVRFAKGHFLHNDLQTIVIDRYGSSPTCKVGFTVEEDLIDYTQDSNLLDPALEASNYSAPGADRFRLQSTLTRYEINDTTNPLNFINLFDIKDGVVQELNERTFYNIVADELAKRTSDESGDYYVRGLNVLLREHLRTANNRGTFTAAQGGDANLISIHVEPGLAYVKGYEVETLVTKYISTPKGTSYSNVNGQIVSSQLGSYIVLNEAVGSWPLGVGQKVDLYDAAQKRITNQLYSTGAIPAGANLVGNARINSVEFDSGNLGQASGNLKLYIYDIKMAGSNAFANVRSVFHYGGSVANMAGDIVVSNTSNTTVINETFIPLLYYVGSPAVKTIRSSDGVSIDTTFTYKKTSNVSIASGGTFSVSASAPELFPYGTTTLTSTNKEDLLLNLNESFNIALPGTALSGAGSNTMNGSSTFFTRLNVGDKFELSNNTKTFLITGITNNTILTVNQNLPTINSNTIYKAYKTGDIIDLRGVGSDAGTTRDVSATSSALSFDLKETLGGTRSGSVNYNVSRSTAKEISKVLNPDRYVIINCASLSSTAGPFNLGFSDVFRIKSITAKTGSAPANTADGTDVTSNYVLDNGQRNSYYDLGSIYPLIQPGSTDQLLIKLDYFSPEFTQGVGYFSVDSYPVNDVNPTSAEISTAEIPIYGSDGGGIYDLRNYIDFRTVYTITAADATTVGAATTNPGPATTVNVPSGGLRIPVASDQVIFDYQNYLPRIDVVALSAEGAFSVIEGTSSPNPITPNIPGNLMGCARIYVTPYPSLSLEYARVLGRTDLACAISRTSSLRYTMRDIGILKNRIDNLEDYVSLSLLEKSALDLKIIDENGLDRFKNGIFTDSFQDASLSSFFDPDHHICFDPVEKSIRPLYEMKNLRYNYLTGSNVVRRGDYILLPYTETALIDQPYATTFRNVETTVYRFVGQLFLDPDQDFWVNTQRTSLDIVNYGDTELSNTPLSTTYGAWQMSSGGGATESWSGSVYAGGAWGDWNSMSAYLKTLPLDTPITYYFNGTYRQTTLGYYTSGPASIILGPENDYGRKDGISPSDTYSVTVSGGGTASRTVTTTSQVAVGGDVITTGGYVTDVAPLADIRPQTIAIHARGLKSNTIHFVYFDGQDMSEFVTPATPDEDVLTIMGLAPTTDEETNTVTDRQYYLSITGPEGSDLTSTANGEIYGLLRLPSDASKTFRTGTKEVIVTDSPTNESDATSTARSYFVAQGILQVKQGEQISTKQYITKTETHTETVSVPGVVSLAIYDTFSCMAYSFLPKVPVGEEGVFLSSVDVYFAAKDPTLGVWFEIRVMDNSGNITRTQVPMSEVHLKSSDVLTSNDGSTATNIKFKTPVFLAADQEYAFVIHTDGINPNYYMFVSVLGENDILTGNPVNQRGLTGSLYTTQNNLDWDIVQRVDLKVKFNRAVFDTTVTGTAYFGNQPIEIITANTVVGPFALNGEIIYGNDRLNLSGIGGGIGSLTIGNRLVGANSNANAIISAFSTTYNMANTGYAVGERVYERYSGNLELTGVSANVTSKSTPRGFLYEFNSTRSLTTIDLTSSNGLFVTGDTIRGNISWNSATVENIRNFPYSTIQFVPSYLTFDKTFCGFDMLATSNAAAVGSYTPIVPNTVVDYLNEMAIFSRSQEISSLGGEQSNKIKATMSTTTDYLSPAIDVSRSYTIYVHNLINSNTANVLSSGGSGLKNQYISKVVTLAEGQDAEDLRVIVSAYRPPTSNSNFMIYARWVHNEDFESIGMRDWVEMEYFDDSVYSSLSSKNDFRDYHFSLPASVLTGSYLTTTGIVQYTNSVGTTFTGFKQFQIKIGLQSDNSAVVPRVSEMRALCLQK